VSCTSLIIGRICRETELIKDPYKITSIHKGVITLVLTTTSKSDPPTS